MYSKEQKDIALRIYHQTESVTETIRILGYPTRRNLYTWIAEENTPPKTRKEYPVINNPPDHPRNPPLEVKLDAIHRCYELGENIKYVSEDIGYSRASIYQWRKRYLKRRYIRSYESQKHYSGNISRRFCFKYRYFF
ncbi:MAG: transposase [Eubacterium sp.]